MSFLLSTPPSTLLTIYGMMRLISRLATDNFATRKVEQLDKLFEPFKPLLNWMTHLKLIRFEATSSKQNLHLKLRSFLVKKLISWLCTRIFFKAYHHRKYLQRKFCTMNSSSTKLCLARLWSKCSTTNQRRIFTKKIN